MTKKPMFKQILALLTVVTACLLLAITPVLPAPDPEIPGETLETGEGETEPGIEPLNDNTGEREKQK